MVVAARFPGGSSSKPQYMGLGVASSLLSRVPSASVRGIDFLGRRGRLARRRRQRRDDATRMGRDGPARVGGGVTMRAN